MSCLKEKYIKRGMMVTKNSNKNENKRDNIPEWYDKNK
jgi:hypothetical protein